MGLGTGTSSPTEGRASLRAMRDGESGALTAGVDDTGGVEDVREDLALLPDASTLVMARQRSDGLLLLLLLVNPFDLAAYLGLGSNLVGPVVLALAAYERVNTSAVRRT